MQDPQPESLSNNPPPRKRGRKVDYYSRQNVELLFQAIKTRGEAIPGDLAQELGWARSTLSYNLGRLQKKGRIVRMGGGRSIRYRVATEEELDAKRPPWLRKFLKPPEKSPVEPVVPSSNPEPTSTSASEPMTNEGEQKGEVDLKDFFKNLLKG
jgi:hypothetical protein